MFDELLCTTCVKLGLSPDKFLIGDDERSAGQGRSNMGPYTVFSTKSSNVRRELGSLANFLANFDSCPLCRLVASSITKGDEDPRLTHCGKEARCYIKWEVDGRKRMGFNLIFPRTRRTHLQ